MIGRLSSRITSFLFLLLLFLLFSWLYDATANRRYLQRIYVNIEDQYDVVAFGDSLIEGLGATQTRGFISILSERLGIDILNQGIRRNTLSDLITRVETDVFPFSPKVVIMTGGGNDVIHRTPWAERERMLRTLFSRFEEEGIRVLYLGVRTGFFTDPYKEVMYTVVAEYPSVVFIPDILDGVMLHPRYSFDFLHPDDAGHERIADSVEPVLRNLLETTSRDSD